MKARPRPREVPRRDRPAPPSSASGTSASSRRSPVSDGVARVSDGVAHVSDNAAGAMRFSSPAEERLYIALSGGMPDRVPFVPKIWIDLAAGLLGEDLLATAGDPESALLSTVRAAVSLELDGARLFHLPARRLVPAAGGGAGSGGAGSGGALEIDGRGRRIGTVDVAGGLATELDDPGGFDIHDPGHVAFAQFRTSREAFVGTMDDVRSLALPDLRFWEEYGAIRRTRAALAAYGDRIGLVGDLGSATLSFCVTLRGLERTLYDLVDDPPFVHALMDCGARIAVARAEANLKAGIRILRLNDSAGTVSLVSPGMWREFIFPRFRDIATEVKRMDPGARIYCHICGDVLPIAKDLVATGIDCIGPLDPLGGSTPRALRCLVGPRMPLMGGIDTMTFLDGPPERVSREAVECMRTGGFEGAFVLGSGCVVPRNTPRAHLVAARDAAWRSGVYRNGVLAAPDP